MKISSGNSLHYFVLLWLGLLCGVMSLNVGAQESGAASSVSSLSEHAASSMDATTESTDLDNGQPDKWNRPWDNRDWNHRWNPREHRRELVSIGHDSTLAAGERADTVVSVFGSSTSDGEVSDAVVSVLGNTRVTGSVGRDVVAVLGNVYVNSKVGHDVVAVAGNVELGPQAEVGGEVTTVGGKVMRDPAAVVRGGTKDLSLGVTAGGFDWVRPWIDHCLRYARPLALAPGLGWAWTIAMLSLLSYVLTAWLMPRAVDRCVTTLETHPGHSLLAALLASLATPILFILLVITVIGILAIPFVGIALLCASFFGKLVMLAWLGRRMTASFNSGAPVHAALATLLGGILVTILYCVPVLGFVTYKLLGFVGFGVVVYALLLSIKGKRQQGSPAASASATQQVYEAQPQAFATADGGVTVAGVNDSQQAGETQQHSAMNAGLPHASFVMRMGALLVDVILVAFILNLIYDSHHILLLALAVYGALMWKFRGTTIGGILFNLRVVRLDGRELDWPTVVVRALSCFLSLIVAGLGFIWIAFDADKQAWHDKIAGTVVVRMPKGVSLV